MTLARSLEGLALRSPDEIMTDERLSQFKASRLSFGCQLVDRLIAERWRIEPVRWDLDCDVRGLACYRILPPDGRELNFVVLSVLVPDDEWVGDAYAYRFDVVCSLIEGPVTGDYLDRFRVEILKKPTEGRAGPETLTWVRSNRSGRAFSHVVGELAAGRQPDPQRLCRIGYLLRSLYYQANAMCGMRSFAAYEPDHPLRLPYAAQSLTSYLSREFGNDLADHVARQASSRAVALDPALKRYLGLGNSTGVGLVNLVTNHPRWMNRWIELRETAAALAMQREERPGAATLLRRLLDRCIVYREEDATDYGTAFLSGPELAGELRRLRGWLDGCASWAALCRLAEERLSTETVECLRALLVTADAETADALAEEAIVAEVDDLHPEIRDVDASMPLPELHGILRAEYAWAFDLDPGRHWAWYKAAVGEYPGLIRPDQVSEPFEDYARDIVGAVHALDRDIRAASGASLAAFLLRHPHHRAIVQWIQTARGLPYATVRMNMLADDYAPMKITRFVLEALKGFEKMEPVDAYSGRAIALQGAPTTEEIAAGADPVWMYPAIPETA
jgi:hypothetical protein